MKPILSFSKSILILVSTIVMATALYGQNPRGSLRGTVQDPTGARIASAKIVAQSGVSSLQREAATGDRGEFRLDDLVPGPIASRRALRDSRRRRRMSPSPSVRCVKLR